MVDSYPDRLYIIMKWVYPKSLSLKIVNLSIQKNPSSTLITDQWKCLFLRLVFFIFQQQWFWCTAMEQYITLKNWSWRIGKVDCKNSFWFDYGVYTRTLHRNNLKIKFKIDSPWMSSNFSVWQLQLKVFFLPTNKTCSYSLSPIYVKHYTIV